MQSIRNRAEDKIRNSITEPFVEVLVERQHALEPELTEQADDPPAVALCLRLVDGLAPPLAALLAFVRFVDVVVAVGGLEGWLAGPPPPAVWPTQERQVLARLPQVRYHPVRPGGKPVQRGYGSGSAMLPQDTDDHALDLLHDAEEAVVWQA